MPRCTVLELEPLELDVLGLEVLLGGRRNRGLDIVADTDGFLGALVYALLCGPNAPGLGALADLLTQLGGLLGVLADLEDAGGAADASKHGGRDGFNARRERPRPRGAGRTVRGR